MFFVVLECDHGSAVVAFELHLVELIPCKERDTDSFLVVTIACGAIIRLSQPFFNAIEAVPFLARVALLRFIHDHQADGADKIGFQFLRICWRINAVVSVLARFEN